MKQSLFIIYLFFVNIFFAYSQAFVPNYDESKIPPYTLPNVLSDADGKGIAQIGDWERRKEEQSGSTVISPALMNIINTG